MSNIHKLIEHLVNNWSNNLSEALAPRVKQQLMDKFKQEADDFDIKIDDKQLSDYIDYFDARLKNNPKVTEKDLAKYPLKALIKLVSAYKGSSKEEDDEDTSNIPDVVYNENGVIIYSGHNEENCLKFGRGEQWCITRGSFGNYRYDSNRKNPTFYLVKDTNLPDSDRKSFFVVVVGSDNTYKVSDRSNNDVGGRGTEWNRWEPWSFVEQQFPSVQGLQRIFRYVPIGKVELSTRQYANNAIDIDDWEVATPDFKERYLIIRKGKKLFNDISNEKFVQTVLPDNQDMATIVAKNYGMIDIDTLLKEFDSFSNQNQKSIIANTRRHTKLSPSILSSRAYPFSAKKAIVRGELIDIPGDERYYVSKDDKAIIKLKFNGDDMTMGLFTEKEAYPNVKINARTSGVLRNLPKFDEIPFETLLKLTKDNLLPKDTVDDVITKSKEEDSKSAIITANTDEGEIVLDTNTFKAYKPENGEYTSIPFEDDSVQNILKSNTVGSGIQDGIVRMVSSFKTIPPSILPMSTVVSILRQTPAEKRVVRKGDESFIIIPSDTKNELNLWNTNRPLDRSSVAYYYKDNGEVGSGRMAYQEIWSNYFDYLRSQNLAYDSAQFLSLAGSSYYAGIKFVAANPPLTADNIYKPVQYEGTWFIINQNNPSESRKISPQTGNLLKANLTPAKVSTILGTRPPAGAARGTRTPAAAATRPPAAAPTPANAGAINTLIANAGLTRGFDALPATFRNRIAAGTVTNVNASRTARSRQVALGNRGRVIGAIDAGQSQMVIIRIGDSTFAQASFQPDARHFIITPTRALNMGRVGNFVDFVSNNANLTETQKETLTRIALGAATKEEIEEMKAKTKPYKDLEVTNEYIIREFDENIDPIELKWHRDNENRVVEIVGKTDWKLQLENQLPVSINQPISIPKGEWHRVIKGNGKLTLKIIKEESTQYNIEGLLLTNTIDRPQKDILSDIRSLPGITIVSSKDYDLSGETSAFSNPNYYTVLKIKVDPHPYPDGFKDEDLQQLFTDIRAIKGVRNFKLNKSVEKKTV
jgi:hypothetical protein